MTGKEYLLKYKAARIEVRRLEEQMAEMDDLVGDITVDPSNEHVQTSRQPDQIGALVARRSDLLSDLMAAKANALETMNEIYQVIGRLEDPDEQLVLQLRYIKLLSWRKVEAKMIEATRVYSRRQMFSIHKRAVKKVEKIINCAPDCTFW